MFLHNTITTSSSPDFYQVTESISVSKAFHTYYQETDEVLIVNWEGEMNSAEIRRGYKEVLSQVKLYKAKKILLDLNNRSFIRRKDQRWVFSTVFPEILRTIGDNVYVAIVLPVVLYYDLVGEMNGDELMQDNNFLIIHHAMYREEAFRWLETMCKPTVAMSLPPCMN